MENINLSAIHISVISKLHEIAEKHGARISISITSNRFGNDLSQMKVDGLDEEMAEWIEDHGYVESATTSIDSLCFELTDAFGSNHSVRYVVETGQFSWTFWLAGHSNERAIDFVKTNDVTEEWTPSCGEPANVSASQKRTEYYGFGGKTYGEIYRTGIALKIFAAAVCDFLHEPEIKVTYP